MRCSAARNFCDQELAYPLKYSGMARRNLDLVGLLIVDFQD